MGFVLAVILSFGPGLVYAYLVYSLDRYEKEPLRLVVGVFLWGAIAAVIGALLLSIIFQAGIYAVTQSEFITEIAGGSVIAPVVEEIYKGLVVLLIYLLRREEFDSVLDGIIYASIAALGFAATENVLYLFFSGYLEGGLSGLLVLFFLRVILGGWNHAFFTAFIGIGLAVRRLSTNGFVKVIAPLGGLALAMFTHALHNSIVALSVAAGGEQGAGVGLLLTLLTDWFGWALIVGIMLWAIGRERRWITRYLQEELREGLLSEAQYQTARSFWRRIGVRRRGDPRATRRFYQAVAELAQKKHQLARFGDERGNTQAVARLRQELQTLAPYAAA